MKNKIDIFFDGKYQCSTNMCSTCGAAKLRYIDSLKRLNELGGYSKATYAKCKRKLNNQDKIKCFFDKGRK